MGWIKNYYLVSTHSRLKAAGSSVIGRCFIRIVSTHSRLKAAGGSGWVYLGVVDVSTHSRLKAAGEVDLF
mgnify:FL=1